MSNHCSCVGTYTPPPDSCTNCTTDCTCLNLGHITVWPDNSVGPCGQTGSVAFDCFDLCACQNEAATFTVIDITPPNILTVNSVTTAGLSFTTTSEAEAYDKVEITLKAHCQYVDDPTVRLGDYTTVTIFIKDLCKDVICGEGESCDKCDGLCADDINLAIG